MKTIKLMKTNLQKLLLGCLLSCSLAAVAEPDPNFHIYLMFGQSNMEGMGTIESQDRITNARVKVLQDQTCSNLSRTYGTWYVAAPPLNRCWSGIGPGDYFGKTMADGMSSSITIGLVPASVAGSDIALYQKSAPIGRANADIPTQFSGGYAWLLDLAKKAQTVGVIKGIIFHQGETNTGDANWKYKVQEIVNNLRTDLGVGNVPFLAGELLYASYGSCCSAHNVEINKLPSVVPNSFVVSASGLPGADEAHFTTASYREFGKRYAQLMLTKISMDAASSVKSSTAAASSKAATSVAAGTGTQCNWYGTTYPICTTASTGWGWENGASCVGRTDCAALASPYGVIGTATSAAASKAASSKPTTSIAASSKAASVAPASSKAASSIAGTGSGSVSCTYVVSNSWATGYTGSIRVTNNGTATKSGWTATWQYAGANRITASWNATVTGANPYSATNLSWNGSIAAGQSVEFGFQGNNNGGAVEMPAVTCK